MRAGLFILPVLVVIAVAVIVALVMLLANAKTRPIGLALLVIPVLLLLLLSGVLFVRQVTVTRPFAAQRTHHMEQRARHMMEARARSSAKVVAEPKPAPAARPSEAVEAIAQLDDKKTIAKTSDAAEPADWVAAGPRKDGDVYKWPVTVQAWPTLKECQDELPKVVDRAVAEYAEKKLGLGPEAAWRVRLPRDYVLGELLTAQWRKPVEVSSETWVELHALLEFDAEANSRIIHEWQRSVINGRLWGVGTAVAAVILVLATLFIYLKIDLATGGSYRGRLRFAAAAVILAVTAVGTLLVVS